MSGKEIQGELFFDQGNTLGYESFQAQIEDRVKDLAKKTGVPIGKRVVLRLRHVRGEHEGIIKLAHPLQPKGDAVCPDLKIGKLVFRRQDIESIRIADAPESES